MPLFTSLHRLTGTAPGPITNEMIDAAVDGHLAETDDLDWKGELIPAKVLALSDFPKDVAAMANRGGGVLVYGVEEADKLATARVDVGPFDERYEAALLSVAVSAISPPIFGLRVQWVGETGNEVMVVIIPSTSDVPHLIYKNDYFGAPIRNDAMTVWMKERQIEGLYRARFEERRQSTETLDNLYDEAATNWTTPARAWLIAVAHPQLPSTASERPDRHRATAIFEAARKNTLLYSGSQGVHPLESVSWENPRPGLRRWVAPNNATGSRAWREAWAAVHHDGSVTLGVAIGGQRTSTEELQQHQIDSKAIESSVSDFMGLVRATSESMGLTEYDVRVGIKWIGSTPLSIQTVDGMGFKFTDNSTPLAQFTPVTASVTADAAPRDFKQQVHNLAEDCINQGGITYVHLIKLPDPDK